MRVVAVILLAGLAMSSAQMTCGYLFLSSSPCDTQNVTMGATDCAGQAQAQDACNCFGPLCSKMTCNAAVGGMMSVAAPMCNSTATPAPIASLGVGRCGSPCYAQAMIFATSACMGTPVIQGGRYAGGDCWNVKKSVCDANFTYEYTWDSADSTCPVNPTKKGSLAKFAIGKCLDFSFPPFVNSSLKYASCVGPTTNAGALMTTNTKFGIHDAAGCTPASLVIEGQETQSTACTLNTDNMEYEKNYCDGGFWGYNYQSSSTCATLFSVSYFKAGCLPIASFGSAMLPSTVQSISIGCATPTKPPNFMLPGGKTAQVSLFSDAGCTAAMQVGGQYGSVDTCMGTVKIMCSTDGSSGTMMIYSGAGCTGLNVFNQTFTKTACTVFAFGPSQPGGPPPVYGQLVNCGAVMGGGTVDPATAPGITLSVAPRVSILVALVVAVLAFATA